MTDLPVLLYSSPSPCGMVHFIFKVLDLDLDEGFTPRSTSNLENQVFFPGYLKAPDIRLSPLSQLLNNGITVDDDIKACQK